MYEELKNWQLWLLYGQSYEKMATQIAWEALSWIHFRVGEKHIRRGNIELDSSAAVSDLLWVPASSFVTCGWQMLWWPRRYSPSVLCWITVFTCTVLKFQDSKIFLSSILSKLLPDWTYRDSITSFLAEIKFSPTIFIVTNARNMPNRMG